MKATFTIRGGLHAVLTLSCLFFASFHAAVCAAALEPEPPAANGPPPTGGEPDPAGNENATPETEVPAAPREPADPQNPLPPTTIPEELSDIRPSILLKGAFDKLAAETNIRLGFANTILFQQASGGPGHRSAAGGDIDLLAKWTAIGAGTPDTGVLAFAAEYRYQIGDQAPSALGGQIGTLIPTTNGFGERPMVIKELYWDQRLFDDRFRFALGRIDPENLFGGHRLQSANTFFLNKAFSSNPAVAYPGQGLAGAAQIKPTDWFFLTAGITDANGKATVGNFRGFFDDHEFLYFAEAGFTPTIEGLGTGRYRLSLWHIDSREDANKPSDEGFTISCDQDLGERFIVFLRYGHAEGDVTNVTDSVQGGVGFRGVFGKENMLGVAAAWSRPADEDLRDEKVVEVFQRFQVWETAQITAGVEVIFDPSNAPDDDVLGVFSARLRISF